MGLITARFEMCTQQARQAGDLESSTTLMFWSASSFDVGLVRMRSNVTTCVVLRRAIEGLAVLEMFKL